MSKERRLSNNGAQCGQPGSRDSMIGNNTTLRDPPSSERGLPFRSAVIDLTRESERESIDRDFRDNDEATNQTEGGFNPMRSSQEVELNALKISGVTMGLSALSGGEKLLSLRRNYRS